MRIMKIKSELEGEGVDIREKLFGDWLDKEKGDESD